MLKIMFDDSYSRALKKAEEPGMLLKDNPLAPAVPGTGKPYASKNMRRLEKDAEMRGCPHNGAVYAGIMDTRYGG